MKKSLEMVKSKYAELDEKVENKILIKTCEVMKIFTKWQDATLEDAAALLEKVDTALSGFVVGMLFSILIMLIAYCCR